MTPTILTYGYTGSTPGDLTAYQQATGALIVDVRLSPRSRVAHWVGSALRATHGANYLAVPALGNRNYATSGGRVVLDNPEAAWRQLAPVLRERPLLLLCACREWRTCHRLVAANWLARCARLPEGGIVHLPARYAEWRDAHEKVLPTTAELTGSDPDFTGGLTTEEFMRRIRGD